MLKSLIVLFWINIYPRYKKIPLDYSAPINNIVFTCVLERLRVRGVRSLQAETRYHRPDKLVHHLPSRSDQSCAGKLHLVRLLGLALQAPHLLLQVEELLQVYLQPALLGLHLQQPCFVHLYRVIGKPGSFLAQFSCLFNNHL